MSVGVDSQFLRLGVVAGLSDHHATQIWEIEAHRQNMASIHTVCWPRNSCTARRCLQLDPDALISAKNALKAWCA